MDVPKPMHRLESGLVQHVPQRFLIHGNHPTAEASLLVEDLFFGDFQEIS
jgi:hypothetical protein